MQSMVGSAENDNDFKVYRSRWLILALYGLQNMANATLFVTFAVSIAVYVS